MRMSTRNQKYSLENQLAAIAKYADCRGIEVTKTYADVAKSGMSLVGRPALARLLADIVSGSANFELVLVYDVSRWGRFQDTDESAHYEFLCNQAGVSIRYCAEDFDDNGMGSRLLKSLKRAMAAEYLRELSVKTFEGQCRTVHQGYRPGGMAPYGLKRILLDENGIRKCALLPGQYKNIKSERVILAPGRPEEITTVRRIFNLFVLEQKSKDTIAKTLNQEGATGGPHNPSGIWQRARVHNILVNENYIGTIVFNRRTQRLQTPSKQNPADKWVRCERAFEGLIEPKLFHAAQKLVLERRRRRSDGEMLDELSMLRQRVGKLSKAKIDECPDVYDSSVYRRRFGSLWNAYALIGHTPSQKPSRLRNHDRVNSAFDDLRVAVIAQIEASGATAKDAAHRSLLKINDHFTLRIVLLTPRLRLDRRGSRHWRLLVRTQMDHDLTLAARLDDTDFAILDYYLLPQFAFDGITVALGDSSWARYNSFRIASLKPLVAFCLLKQNGRPFPKTCNEFENLLSSN